jgi:MHS family proline/betaine transporter-like MFS transporter
MSQPTTDPAAGAPASKSALPAAFASVAGWAFDLFDLFLLLYVAKAVGHQIFPAESETLSLALVFASFAVSIVMRPAGAAFFGELADRKGRKTIMVTVLAGVGLSTAAMGLVPTYASIGVVAPIIFLVLRVIQGLFVGGVTATTHTLGTESVPPRWRGLMSGLIGAGGAGLGAAMASVVFIIVSRFYPGDSFNEFGWRVMFFSGLMGGLLSLFVLRKVEESPMWLKAQEAAKSGVPAARMRFLDLIAGEYRSITLLNIAVAAGGGAMYYLTSGFLEASQRYGRRKTMLALGAVNIVALPILTLLIARSDPGSTTRIMLAACLLAFLANAAYSPVMIFLNERYPTAIRSRGTAVSWNTGFMLGGLLPTFVNLLSPTVSDIPGRLVAFIIGAAAVFIAAVLWSPETRGRLDTASTAEDRQKA